MQAIRIARDSAARRDFLKLTAGLAGGSLLLGFGLPGCDRVGDALSNDAVFAPNAFLRIDSSGKVTLIMPMVEMGQGTYTALPMLIAEELEVSLDRVTIEHAPADDEAYVNPLIGLQVTGGSTAIRAMYVPLRHAGATARVMLVAAAAKAWGVEPSTCRTVDGMVVHEPSGRSMRYGQLVEAAAALPVPQDVALKEPRGFRLIGTPHRRLDVSGKIDGSVTFGIDARLGGMQFAALAMSPVFGGKLIAFDEQKAKSIPGVSQIVALDDAIAVVGRHTWAAKQGLLAANPQWDAGPNARLSTGDVVAKLVEATQRPGATARRDGDAESVLGRAARRVSAMYEQPFLAHATMEPMNCTVHVTPQGCDIWVGTQIPGRTQKAVMRLTGLERDQVDVHNHFLGGGFGRRLEVDGTLLAVRIARHVKTPVQVIWSREEDIQHDMYRPYYVDRLSAAVGERGEVIAWSHRIAGSSIMARVYPDLVKDGVDPDAVEGSANMPYDVANVRVTWMAQEPPAIPTAFWRGVGVTRGTFVVESFIDELAAFSRRDPLEFRVDSLRTHPRAQTVLQIVAERAAWNQPLTAGRGRGIALCTGFGSYIAQVVEVAVEEDGTVRPMQVWCVVDCGIVVNADTVRAQMEGGIVFGLSAALYGEVTIKNGRVEQSNFSDYRVLRIHEAPKIDVHVVKSDDEPGGIGEPGTSCVMPALTNAVFAATGKRIRKLPVAAQLQGTRRRRT